MKIQKRPPKTPNMSTFSFTYKGIWTSRSLELFELVPFSFLSWPVFSDVAEEIVVASSDFRPSFSSFDIELTFFNLPSVACS